MKVLVTGANGMLGIDLCAELETAGHTVVRADASVRDGLTVPAWVPIDVTNTQAIKECILYHQPDAVIHAAAYTDVDGCERNPDLAYRVNALGTWNVAAVCGAHRITLVYISTDFVFDGTKQTPYTEYDAPNPLSHYGASKLAGERHVAALCPRHFIVRSSWMFGIHGKNFPDIILRKAASQPEIGVVCDQFGSPTYAPDLSRALVSLLESPLYGTYHITNSGHCCWYEFAQKAVELAGLKNVVVKPMPAELWPSPTKRPAYSVLRHYALELQGRDNLPPWTQALSHFIAERAKAL
jgi:dTDP-4-dehydrorhamnose reductase